VSCENPIAPAYPLDQVAGGDGSRPQQKFLVLDPQDIEQVLLGVGDLSHRRLYRRQLHSHSLQQGIESRVIAATNLQVSHD